MRATLHAAQPPARHRRSTTRSSRSRCRGRSARAATPRCASSTAPTGRRTGSPGWSGRWGCSASSWPSRRRRTHHPAAARRRHRHDHVGPAHVPPPGRADARRGGVRPERRLHRHRLVEVTAQGRSRALAMLALRRTDEGIVRQHLSFELPAEEVGDSGLVMVGLEHPRHAPEWSRRGRARGLTGRRLRRPDDGRPARGAGQGPRHHRPPGRGAHPDRRGEPGLLRASTRPSDGGPVDLSSPRGAPAASGSWAGARR